MKFYSTDEANSKRLGQVRARIMMAIADEMKIGEITSQELLAVMAHATGGCIALQDKEKIDVDLALEIVAQNVEVGNKETCEQIRNGR